MAKSVKRLEDWATRAKLVGRPWRTASSRLREAAEDVLAGAFERLEQRVGSGGRDAGQVGSRLREVVERDRAFAEAQRPAPSERAPASEDAPTSEGRARPDEGPPECNEPIRTRTFARILADQGEYARALSVYAYLLYEHSDDAELVAEVAKLRDALAEADDC